MLTPYVAQVLLRASVYSAVAVYALLGFLAAVVALMLPVETAGQDLDDDQGGFTSYNQETTPERGLAADMEENEREQEKEERF